MSISSSQSQYVTSGTPVNFTISVKNNDRSACTGATFNLSDTLPAGAPAAKPRLVLSVS